MLQISEINFSIDTHHRDRAELERHALALFERYEGLLNLQLKLDDYAIELDLENGSLLGKGKVWATVGGIYIFVCGYGSFASGIETLASHARAVSDYLVNEAPQLIGEPSLKATKKRSSDTQLDSLQKLFRKVQQGKLDPDDAAKLALEILSQSNDELPEGLPEAVRQSFHSLEHYPVQDTLFGSEDLVVGSLPSLPLLPKPKPGDTAPVIVESNSRLRVEVRRSGKNKETEVTVTEVKSKSQKRK